MRRSLLSLCLALLGSLLASGCAAPRPQLYPNAHLEQVGQARAEADIAECMQRAEQYVREGGAARQKAAGVARQTTIAAGTGAAIGAVAGAINGNVGRAAATGAATGATAGFLSSMFNVFGGPSVDPVKSAFVDTCLREKGYQPIGWR